MATSEDIPQCGKWQPIETAPKDGTWIIGANGKTPTRPIQCKDGNFKTPYFLNGEWVEFWGNCTHWTPLPLPPETECVPVTPSPEQYVWGGPETPPELYRTVHDAATAVYEASTPADYRYSASALRQAVDAGIRAALATTEGSNNG